MFRVKGLIGGSDLAAFRLEGLGLRVWDSDLGEV